MSTLDVRRIDSNVRDGRWRKDSRAAKARGYAVTVAKRKERHATRQNILRGEFDTLASFGPIRSHMANNDRCPFCGTPFWFCPC